VQDLGRQLELMVLVGWFWMHGHNSKTRERLPQQPHEAWGRDYYITEIYMCESRQQTANFHWRDCYNV
jgi:hypothetical protein